MATKFPSFSQGLAQDPTTRRIWYGIATAHDFESHDGMTEEQLYQKLFSTHFGHLAIIGLWVAGNLFHIAWQGNFAQSSITINGWLRDFLWAQSSQVLTSYGQPISMYGLMFLGAHFVWAFSLMFLFSGRGYWQELFESIIWAHNKLNLAPTIQPRALSITQGRAVGGAHFLLGGIATTWAFFHARLIGLG